MSKKKPIDPLDTAFAPEPVTFQEYGKKEDAKKEEGPSTEKMAEGGMDVSSIVKAIKDGSISVADMDAIVAAIAAQKGAGAEVEVESPEAAAPAAEPGAAMSRSNLSQLLAKIQGENEALRARLDERDAAERRRDEVAQALLQLHGRPLGANVEAKLTNFHAKYGSEAFAAYVQSMSETFAASDGDGDADAAAFSAQAANVPTAAMEWQKHGTDAMEKATLFAREWQDLKSRGLARQTESRYVEINMHRIGLAPSK